MMTSFVLVLQRLTFVPTVAPEFLSAFDVSISVTLASLLKLSNASLMYRTSSGVDLH